MHTRVEHRIHRIQDYVQGAHGQMTGDEGAVQGAMLQGVLLASVAQAYVCVWLSPFCVRR